MQKRITDIPNIYVEFFSVLIDKKIKDGIKKLLIESDNDFVPSLSSRIVPKNSNQIITKNESDITDYYNSIMHQKFIVLYGGNEIIGFTTFVNGVNIKSKISGIKENFLCNYYTTAIIDKRYRGLGLGTKIMGYSVPEDYKNKYHVTRTWSSNQASIYMLYKLGYSIYYRIENERAEGVDTIFFLKEMPVFE